MDGKVDEDAVWRDHDLHQRLYGYAIASEQPSPGSGNDFRKQIIFGA